MNFLQILIRSIIKNSIVNYQYLYSEYLNNKMSVLDVGCGNGMWAKIIKKTIPGIFIQGLDLKNYLWKENRDIPMTLYDGINIPFSNSNFDASLLFFVLHHADNPERVLTETLRVSKKHLLILEEIYSNSIQKWLMIIYDILVNLLIFGERISIPKFKTKEEWESIFYLLSVSKIKTVILKKTLFFLPQRVLFVINK